MNKWLLAAALASTLGLALGAGLWLLSRYGLVVATLVALPALLVIGLLVQAAGILTRGDPPA